VRCTHPQTEKGQVHFTNETSAGKRLINTDQETRFYILTRKQIKFSKPTCTVKDIGGSIPARHRIRLRPIQLYVQHPWLKFPAE
jgi:hypothetical protein